MHVEQRANLNIQKFQLLMKLELCTSFQLFLNFSDYELEYSHKLHSHRKVCTNVTTNKVFRCAMVHIVGGSTLY